MSFWLHVQDLVDAYIGPFPTATAANDHFQWQQAQGDSAIMLGISQEEPPADGGPCGIILSPGQDLAFDRRKN